MYLHRLKHTHEIQIIHTSHSIIYIVIQSKKNTFESFESFEAFVKKTIKKSKNKYTKNIIIESGIKFTYTKSIDEKKKNMHRIEKDESKTGKLIEWEF